MTLMLLVLVRGELAVIPAVTAVLFYHSAVDTGNDFIVVSTV